MMRNAVEPRRARSRTRSEAPAFVPGWQLEPLRSGGGFDPGGFSVFGAYSRPAFVGGCMVQFSQAGRFLRIETPLGPDAVILERLAGREAISQPFEFELHLLAPEPIAFGALLGERVRVAIEAPGCPPRVLCGLINELGQGEEVLAPGGLIR